MYLYMDKLQQNLLISTRILQNLKSLISAHITSRVAKTRQQSVDKFYFTRTKFLHVYLHKTHKDIITQSVF